MSDKLQSELETGEFLLYQTEDGQTRLAVAFRGETCWISLNQLSELFQRDKSVISRHISNIFSEGELARGSVVANFATTAADGKNYQVDYYNLDVIISVAYRVKSHRGTQFRIGATQRLRDYIVKGFAMDDERLKRAGGGNYFDELLARIRDIRSAEKENMGLTHWLGCRPGKTEAVIAKNYLTPDELDMLNRIVNAYLEFTELQALNRKPMYMQDWIDRLDDFLKMSGRELLTHAGTISHEQAIARAQIEYEKLRSFQINQPSPVEKHFDQAVKIVSHKALKKGKK